MTSSMSFALRGTFVHAPDIETVEVLQDTFCFVSGRRHGGNILAICPAAEADSTMKKLGLQITVHNIPVYDLRNFVRLMCLRKLLRVIANCVGPLADTLINS